MDPKLNPETFNKAAFAVTGGIQLGCGILTICLALVQIAFIYNAGPGGWAAIMLILAGTFGLGSLSGKHCVVVTYLVLSIICSIFAGYLVIAQVILIGVITVFESGFLHEDYNVTGGIVIAAVSIFVAVTACVNAIIGSAFSCRALRCCCGGRQTEAQQTDQTVTVVTHQGAYVGPTGMQEQPPAYPTKFEKLKFENI